MKNQKGITLIALVITIIVMLILAGVTISTLVGEDGIIEKAESAGTKMDLAQVKERAELVALDFKIDIKAGNYTAKNFKNEYFDRMKEEFGEDNCKCNGSEVEIQTTNGKAYVTTNNKLDVIIFNEEDKKIYCEEIASIYNDMNAGKISPEVGMKKLEEKNVTEYMFDGYYNSETEETTIYMYVYNLNALYELSNDWKNAKYIPKEEYLEKYEFLEDVTVGKNELEKFLIDMHVGELLKTNSNIIGEFVIPYIENKSEKIIDIDEFDAGISNNGTSYFGIKNVTVLNGERERTFGYDIGYDIDIGYDVEDGKITKIIVEYGT